MRRLIRAFEVAVTVVRVADDHDVTYPAASVAYYAFVSQVPILIWVLAIFRDRFVRQAQTIMPTYLTPNTQELLSETLTTASGGAWAALLAVGVLAWSGANIILCFQTVIDRVEHRTKESLFPRLRDAGSILGSFCLAIIAVLLTRLVFTLLPVGRVLAYSEPLVQFCILTVAFLPLYYGPSQVVTSSTGALPGALTAAAGLTILLTVVKLYAVSASQYALFGALSGIIIILTSLYLASVVLMLGIVVNTVTAGTDDVAGSTQL